MSSGLVRCRGAPPPSPPHYRYSAHGRRPAAGGAFQLKCTWHAIGASIGIAVLAPVDGQALSLAQLAKSWQRVSLRTASSNLKWQCTPRRRHTLRRVTDGRAPVRHRPGRRRALQLQLCALHVHWWQNCM